MTQTVIVGSLTKLPFEGHIIDGIEHVAFEVEADIQENGRDTGRKALILVHVKDGKSLPKMSISSLIGIKGHIDVGSYIGVDGIPSRMIHIVADKITVLQ